LTPLSLAFLKVGIFSAMKAIYYLFLKLST